MVDKSRQRVISRILLIKNPDMLTKFFPFKCYIVPIDTFFIKIKQDVKTK